MISSLPISNIVAVSVQLTPAAAQAQSLRDLLILGTSAVIDTFERYRIYSSMAALALDFGTTTEEYKAALKWFSQSPQPTKLYIGRWINVAAKGGLRCASLAASAQLLSNWTSITNGGFKVAKDGAAETNITGLNFSAATSLNGVAAIIQAGLSGITCVWNANFKRFEFESSTTGPTSSVAFLNPPTSGTNIATQLGGSSVSSGAYVYQGQAIETADAAVALYDNVLGQKWYGLNIPAAADSDHLLVAAYIEAANNKHIYGLTTASAGVLVAATTSDIASVMKAAGYRRSMVQYSSTDPNAVVSAMARILTTDFNGNATVITLKFKQEPSVTAENLNATQVASTQAKNANIFVLYNNDTAILQEGTMCDGTFVDIVTGTDWLAVTIQTAIYNLLYTSTTKIPQTDQGMQILTSACEAVCIQAVLNGLLAPGVWNANGFGQLAQGDYMPKGFYIYNAKVDTQNQSDRVARLAMPIQIAAKLAGAIHFANVAIVVNQ